MARKQRLGKKQLQWVEALESGDYKQTKGVLVHKARSGNRYCCLGVQCVLFKERHPDRLTTKVMKDVMSDKDMRERKVLSFCYEREHVSVFTYLTQVETTTDLPAPVVEECHFRGTGGDVFLNNVPSQKRVDEAVEMINKYYPEFDKSHGSALAGLNDKGMSFPEIAALIRLVPEAIFSKSA